MALYDTVVTREASWFTAEPPASFPTAPSLIASAGGPFDVVQGYLRALSKRGRELYILRERTENRRLDFGEKDSIYHMVAVVLWSITSATLETDQQRHDTAVSAVLSRIIGPPLDHTHGGAFTGVAEDGTAISVEPQNLIQSLFAGSMLETHIRYTAYETFPA